MPFRQLTHEQRDATRKCSKSQVAVIARLVRDGVEEPLYVARCAQAASGRPVATL